jgi:hypothetical protein
VAVAGEADVRVIVCGSRDFDADHIMTEALDELCNMGDVVIVHGAARGADALASAWAKLERGWRFLPPVRVAEEPHPAEWEKHGKAAGPIRNRAMAAAGADLCLAFWDGQSRGTADMIATATRCGIPVRIVPWRKR